VEKLIAEVRQDVDWRLLQLNSENRALPLKNSDLEMIRARNLRLSQSKTSSENQQTENSGTSAESPDELKPQKTVQRRMYDLLFSPVEDILSKLPKESPLIIVPDKVLHSCPFNLLQDFLERYAFKRFRISYSPSILLLDKMVANELNHLRQQDDLDFERQIHRKGGVLSLTNKFGSNSGTVSGMSGSYMSEISPRHVTHPRLLTRPMMPPKPGSLPKQGTMFEEDFKKRSPWKTPRTPRGQFKRSHHLLK